MSKANLDNVMDYLRRIVGPPVSAASDHVLVARFLENRDEAAFAALLKRHGLMVFRVCRRLLLREQDAEDVVQAAFLLLARKAGRIRKHASLGCWLHGVAHRLSLRLKRQEMNRLKREQRASAMRGHSESPHTASAEIQELLGTALQALPEKNRAALILCCLEGRTQEEAARQLGCPLGTLQSRLARGRTLLQKQLERHGLTLSAAGLASFLTAQNTLAALPIKLFGATLKASIQYASGKSLSGLVSASVALLVNNGLKYLALTKLMWISLGIITLGLVVGGTGVAAKYSQGGGQETSNSKQMARVQTQQEPKRKAPKAEVEKPRTDLLGDPLPQGTIARLGTNRLRHGASPRAVVFAPDGRSLASAGIDATVHIWDTGTGKEILRIENDKFQRSDLGAVFSLSYAPDGKTLAGTRLNQPVCLWNVETGKELLQFGGERHRAHWVVFSPDGKTLAYGGKQEDQIRLAEVSTGKDLQQFGKHKGFVSKAAFSPDGTLIASADEEAIYLFEIAASRSRELHRNENPTVRFNFLAFAPDGKTLAAASAAGKMIRFIEVESGKALRTLTLDATEQVGPVVFLPDGKTLISSHWDGFVRFWDVATGNKVRQFRAHMGGVAALALSRDGNAMATSAISGNDDNAVRLWETDTGKPLVRYPGPQQGISRVAFSPDSRRVATSSGEGAAQLWEAATGKLLYQWEWSGPLAVSPDNQTLVYGGWKDGQIHLVSLVTGKEILRIPAHQIGIGAISLTRDGKNLATAGYDDSIRFWELETGKPIHDFGGKLKSSATSIALSPDGKLLASTHDADDTVRLWDTASGKLIREDHDLNHVWSVVFSPDGQVVAYTCGVGREPMIKLREVASGKVIHQFQGEGGPNDGLAFSPDGRTLIWNGSYPKDLFVWEMATGQLRRTIKADHQGYVSCIAFSPDGQMIATGGSDGSGLILDISRVGERQNPPLPLSAAQLDKLWSDLADADAKVAYQAMCTLRASPRQCVQLFEKQLKQVPHADAKRLAETMRNLDSSEFKIRNDATRELESLGEAAELPLRKMLADRPSLEMRQRVERLLERIDGPNKLRQGRALEVLEQIGDSSSRRCLTVLEEGSPQARLTQEAKTSLDRLKKRDAKVP